MLFRMLHPFRPCNSKVHWYRRLGLRHETQHLPKELSDKQPADILQYTKSHSEEVEAEYQQVLAYADENRRYWESIRNQMPKLYEYLGIIIYFWSNEHEPIHVHGEYQGKENKAELFIEDGKVSTIRFDKVKGHKPLDGNELKDFEIFVRSYADEIVRKWIDYFILHKKVGFERITRRIK